MDPIPFAPWLFGPREITAITTGPTSHHWSVPMCQVILCWVLPTHHLIRQNHPVRQILSPPFYARGNTPERVSDQLRTTQLIRNRARSPNPQKTTPQLLCLKPTLSFRTDVCKREALGARSFWKENANPDKVCLTWFFAFVVLSQAGANLEGTASRFFFVFFF